MLQYVLIVVFVASCSAIPLKFTDCGSVGAKINQVMVPECTADPCVLHHGKNYSVQVDFDSMENSATAKTVVHGIIGGVPVPFPVPSDCCNNHNLKCPITSGQKGVYQNNLFCSPAYPKIKLIGKFEVIDENGKDFFCFALPLEIQD